MTPAAPRTKSAADGDGSGAPASAGSWTARRGPDLALVAVFALFAIFFFVDRFRGVTPFAFLDGDAANIASFVAATDHPELFAGDEVLGNPQHFKYYRTIHIPLLRWLGGVFGGRRGDHPGAAPAGQVGIEPGQGT